MPDLFYLVSKWWKQVTTVVVLSLATAGAVLFIKPVKYLSVTTALPASSYATDKASVFNKSIQLLYPAMGTPDDLDMLVGTAQLDTVYIAVAQEFGLPGYYKVKEQGEAAVRKAAYLLKANTKVIKSDFSELKVKVWDGNKTLAPQLANAITEKLQTIHQDIRNSNNITLIKNLEAGKEKLQQSIDSINVYLSRTLIEKGTPDGYVSRRAALVEQVQQYEKLANEYRLLVDNKPPVLIIVEKARVSDWPDKPRIWQVLAATFVLSLLFALLVILLLERKSPQQ